MVPIAALVALFSLSTVPASAASADSAVLALEQRLSALSYDPGTPDGVYDQDTSYAVMAFQKVNRLQPTGQPTPDVIQALNATSTTPTALVPGGGANRVEIDLNRQVLFLYVNEALVKILPVSTGNGERYCSGGRCRNAITPTGSFAIQRQAQGWERSPLGSLYNPQYFVGGIAIHGSKSVPATPASHGCVRIPLNASQWFPSYVTLGTPVYVL